MRGTQFLYVKGKVKASWLHRADDAFGGTPKYKIVIYPDTEGLTALRNLQQEGLKNVEKRDDDGSYFTFNRPTFILVKGKTVGLEPVEVLKPDGTPLRETLLGAGSDVTVKLEVYSHKVPGRPDARAKAARLMAVRVDNLIPFDIKKDFTESQEKIIGGLMEQPLPNF